MKNNIEEQKRKLQEYFLNKILKEDFKIDDGYIENNLLKVTLIIDGKNEFNLILDLSQDECDITQDVSFMSLEGVITKENCNKLALVMKKAINSIF